MTGRNVLIGGSEADVLLGGTGDDLLLAGDVDFGESQLEALLAIHAEWISPRSYTQRVENISGRGSGPRENLDFFLPVSALSDQAAIDLLVGQGGMDWFLYEFFTDLLGLAEPEEGEIRTDINS